MQARLAGREDYEKTEKKCECLREERKKDRAFG
jgi:hypothetical protein